ncbi:hypothetical protein [Roseiconus lacunae]|uniref:hypothetical protein n=1 Tax=Roseiconus lacunae TaxID=2605694 RepID=UPI0011F0AD60|nr:hypothetical protein [Roseiconus lacunae]
MFFKLKANLSDAEKSRIEFHLQQIAECVGFDRLTLPVLSRKSLSDLYESEKNPQHVIEHLGDHLKHDVGGIQLRVVPQQSQSSCSSGGCGGGNCSGPSGLAGHYEASNRSITLEMEIDSDPLMGLAALINGVVCDLLHQSNFGSASHPERVELAVVATGLGAIRNHVSLVKKQAKYWDSTQWDVSPRPFLDCQSLAYVNALAAWARGDTTPEWLNDLPSELKRPIRNSLKFLLKTNDSFFQPQQKQFLLGQSQREWWQLASSSSVSKQVVAIRHLDCPGNLDDRQVSLLLDKLRSPNRAIMLHAIAAIERLGIDRQAKVSEPVIRQLRHLAEHRDDEVRAKTLCTVARLGELDESTVESAAMMLEANQKHLVFASVYALATLTAIPDHILKALDRCFVRALRSCDYEFVDLFVAAYKRWLDDPQSHFQMLLQDSPEHLPIAIGVLQKVPQQIVQIRRGA